jgi:preprotein translocase subunit SecE
MAISKERSRIRRILRTLRPRIPKYFKESITELKKVTWPGRKEALKLTLAVFIFSAFFALIIVIADFGFQKLAERLFL